MPREKGSGVKTGRKDTMGRDIYEFGGSSERATESTVSGDSMSAISDFSTDDWDDDIDPIDEEYQADLVLDDLMVGRANDEVVSAVQANWDANKAGAEFDKGDFSEFERSYEGESYRLQLLDDNGSYEFAFYDEDAPGEVNVDGEKLHRWARDNQDDMYEMYREFLASKGKQPVTNPDIYDASAIDIYSLSTDILQFGEYEDRCDFDNGAELEEFEGRSEGIILIGTRMSPNADKDYVTMTTTLRNNEGETFDAQVSAQKDIFLDMGDYYLYNEK